MTYSEREGEFTFAKMRLRSLDMILGHGHRPHLSLMETSRENYCLKPPVTESRASDSAVERTACPEDGDVVKRVTVCRTSFLAKLNSRHQKPSRNFVSVAAYTSSSW